MRSLSKEEREEMAQPLTPKREWPRKPWDPAPMSLQVTPGLCGNARVGKGGCWRKVGHKGACE